MKGKILILSVLLISFYSYSQNFNPKDTAVKLLNDAAERKSPIPDNKSNAVIQQDMNSYYGIEKAKSNLVQQIKNAKDNQSELEKFKRQNKVKEQKMEKSSSIVFVELKKPDLLKKKNQFQFKEEIFLKKNELKSLKLRDSIFKS